MSHKTTCLDFSSWILFLLCTKTFSRATGMCCRFIFYGGILMTSKAVSSWIIQSALAQAQLKILYKTEHAPAATQLSGSLCSCCCYVVASCSLSYRFCTFLWLCLCMKTPARHRAPAWSQQSHGWSDSDSPSSRCRHQAERYQWLLFSTLRIPRKQTRWHSGMKTEAFLLPLGTNDFLSRWEIQQMVKVK